MEWLAEIKRKAEEFGEGFIYSLDCSHLLKAEDGDLQVTAIPHGKVTVLTNGEEEVESLVGIVIERSQFDKKENGYFIVSEDLDF